MASKVLYFAAVSVLLVGLVLTLAPDAPCGMDEDLCMAQRGPAPLIAGIAIAALLAYVARALMGNDRRPER